VYNELKDYKKAVESYKQAILIQPGHTYAHYGLGMIYLVQGHRNSAVKEYEILKDLDRDTADKLFNTIYKNFRKATQENPQHADAFFYLGWLHNKKGNYEKTVEAYQEVIRINPDYGLIQNWKNIRKLLMLLRRLLNKIQKMRMLIMAWDGRTAN